MIQNNINLKEENGVTQQDLLESIAEGREISDELRKKLAKIRINVNVQDNPEIINAIERIFGSTYISKAGNSVITYDMYCSTLNLIRELGKQKSQEIL